MTQSSDDTTFPSPVARFASLRSSVIRVVVAAVLFAASMVTPVATTISRSPTSAQYHSTRGWQLATAFTEDWLDQIRRGTFNPRALIFSPFTINGLFVLVLLLDVTVLASLGRARFLACLAKWLAIVAFAYAFVGLLVLGFGLLVSSAVAMASPPDTHVGPAVPLWFAAYFVQVLRPRRRRAMRL